jgi:DNA-binding transcriptional MerR regulator
MRATGPDGARGVYGISVAAELVSMGVQTLRLYEARGLLTPDRTAGGTRRYSANDLNRLRRISDLLNAGLNLAGIAMVITLQDENQQLRTQNRRAQNRRPTEREAQSWQSSAPIAQTVSTPADQTPTRAPSPGGPRRQS